MPFHGRRCPTKISGNLIGKITASFRAFLAPSRPATSYHFTLGFSRTMAPSRLVYSCVFGLLGSVGYVFGPLGLLLPGPVGALLGPFPPADPPPPPLSFWLALAPSYIFMSSNSRSGSLFFSSFLITMYSLIEYSRFLRF